MFLIFSRNKKKLLFSVIIKVNFNFVKNKRGKSSRRNCNIMLNWRKYKRIHNKKYLL